MPRLALSHGNADVEHDFSANQRLITTDRATLKSNTINARRLVKDTIRINANGVATDVSVTPALLTHARLAYGKNKEYLEEQRKKMKLESNKGCRYNSKKKLKSRRK